MSTMDTLINAIKDQNPSIDVTAADSDKTLEGLGLDSLDTATVIMEVEDALNVKIGEADITGETTLKEFCALLEK
jgi:acyl carrier protein